MAPQCDPPRMRRSAYLRGQGEYPTREEQDTENSVEIDPVLS